MGYRIGSFNCLNFGRATSKDVGIFVDIISKEQFDIIALQEVKGSGALNRILTLLPSYWRGIADDDSNVNDYAFVWNSRRFALAEFEDSNTKRIYIPRIYKQYRVLRSEGQRELIREPYFARFFPIGGSAPFIEIRIINTHIRYSKGKSDDESEDFSPGAIKMRENEYNVLTRAIYAKEEDKRYGNNRPAYTILLGDYNLNMRESAAKAPYLPEPFFIIDGKNQKLIFNGQVELTTLKKCEENTSDSNSSKDIFANNYDHFTFDSNRFNDVSATCKSINAVEKYLKNNVTNYTKKVSDHIPIVMDLSINKRGN